MSNLTRIHIPRIGLGDIDTTITRKLVIILWESKESHSVLIPTSRLARNRFTCSKLSEYNNAVWIVEKRYNLSLFWFYEIDTLEICQTWVVRYAIPEHRYCNNQLMKLETHGGDSQISFRFSGAIETCQYTTSPSRHDVPVTLRIKSESTFNHLSFVSLHMPFLLKGCNLVALTKPSWACDLNRLNQYDLTSGFKSLHMIQWWFYRLQNMTPCNSICSPT